MISMQKLMTEGKELEKSQGKGVTAELLPLAMLSFLNASATVETYWTYVPDHPVLSLC